MYGAARSPAVVASTLIFLLFSCRSGGGKGQHLSAFLTACAMSPTRKTNYPYNATRRTNGDLLEIVSTARKRYSHDG